MKKVNVSIYIVVLPTIKWQLFNISRSLQALIEYIYYNRIKILAENTY